MVAVAWWRSTIGHLDHVALGVAAHRAVDHGERGVERPLEVAVVHLHRLHPGGRARRHARRTMPADRSGVRCTVSRVNVGHRIVVGEQRPAVLGHLHAADEHRRRPRVGEIGEQHHVGEARRGDRTEHVVEPEVHGGVERGHADGHGRRHAGATAWRTWWSMWPCSARSSTCLSSAQKQMCASPPPSASTSANTAGVLSFMLPAITVIVAPEAQAVEHLVGGERVVVVADPAGQVGPQRLVGQARGVPGDPLAGGQRGELLARRRLAEVERVALAERHRVGQGDAPQHLVLGHDGTAELHVGQARHLGRDLLEDAQRRARGADEVDGRPAPSDVGDAVRIGEQRGRAARHDQPGQLARREHRVLDVDVRVDEVRHEEQPVGVDHRRRVEPSDRGDRGDVRAGDDHVARAAPRRCARRGRMRCG